MGGSRAALATIAFGGMLVPMLAACDRGDDAEPEVIDAADAYTAIVSWQAAEQPPILDDDGEPQLPVIYVVAANGDTIDVGVQAEVTEATADEAVVRFADDANDTFDRDLDGAPVHDDGVMLSIGAVPDPARSVDVDIDRFTSEDEYESLSVEVRVDDGLPSSTEQPRRAAVTNATQR